MRSVKKVKKFTTIYELTIIRLQSNLLASTLSTSTLSTNDQYRNIELEAKMQPTVSGPMFLFS